MAVMPRLSIRGVSQGVKAQNIDHDIETSEGTLTSLLAVSPYILDGVTPVQCQNMILGDKAKCQASNYN